MTKFPDFVTCMIGGEGWEGALHGVSLMPFHVQSRALRRAWTVEMSRGLEQVEDTVQESPSVFVSPTIDPVGRRLGLTVVW